MSKTKAQKAIRQYAEQQLTLVQKKQKCSCHAMADIWAYATRYYKGFLNNDEETYVEDVSYILSGVNEWATRTDGTQVGRNPTSGGFTDSGFKKIFKDSSNQVQHFSAGVMAGFQYGRWARILHSTLRPDTPQDESLNNESTWLGANLNGIGTSLAGVKSYIEKNVCEIKCGICNNGKGR